MWILILACGCEQEKIQVYRVAKENVPSLSKLAATTPPTQERIEWTVPAGWEEKEPSATRYGSIAISGENGAAADLDCFALGRRGGVLANVNRWRDRLNLGSILEAQLSQNIHAIGCSRRETPSSSTSPVMDRQAVRKDGQESAILPHDSSTWFFKMTGDGRLSDLKGTICSIREDGAASPDPPMTSNIFHWVKPLPRSG